MKPKPNPLDNQNPRVGVLLKLYGASQLLIDTLVPYHRWGLKKFSLWATLNWWGYQCEPLAFYEWRALLARRERKMKKVLAARRGGVR